MTSGADSRTTIGAMLVAKTRLTAAEHAWLEAKAAAEERSVAYLLRQFVRAEMTADREASR